MVIPFSVDRSSDKRIAREGTSDVGYHPDWNRFSRLSSSRRTPFVVLSRVLEWIVAQTSLCGCTVTVLFSC